MKTPLVSVIVPCYNKQSTINQSLQSLFDQSFENFEIIVIDDASTDSSKKMLEPVHDPRMKKIYLVQNQGVVNAYREGIRRARGKYVMFHDSDDMSLPDRIEKCVAAMESTDADVLYHSMYVMARHPDPQIPIMARVYRPAQRWEENRIYTEQYIPGVIFAKKSILEKVKIPKEAEHAWDWMHHIQLHQLGAKYTRIMDGLYEYYRFPNSSLSHKNEMDGTRQKSVLWIQAWLKKNKIVKRNHVFGKGFKGIVKKREERPNESR